MSFSAAVDILDKLEAIGTKRKEKENLLKASAGLFELKAIFVMAYDWMITYGIKVKEVKRMPPLPLPWAARDEKFGEFAILAEALSKRELTGNKAKEAWNEFIGSCSNSEAVWFSRVMNRDLKIGIAETTIAKIWPGALSEFSCQLAPTDPYVPGQDTEFPVYVEPKYDGIRVLVVVSGNKATVHSRNGKELPGLQHFADKIAEACPGEYVVDGEVFHDNWNSTISVSKTHPDNLTENERALLKEIKYYVFDTVPLKDFKAGSCALPMALRNNLVENIVSNVLFKYSDCGIVQTPFKVCNSHQEIADFYTKCLEDGFEGAMIKSPSAGYKFGRSKAWLKLKSEETYDATILEVLPGTGRNENRLGAFKVRLENGDEGNVGSGFSDKQREEFWAARENLIGKTIEFKAQKDPNQVAVIRFPRFVRMRDDK